MPRQSRDDRAGQIYHALNRGNQRRPIFHKPEDYQAFLRVLHDGLQKYSVELFCFTLMPNHWHFVLRPTSDGQMGQLLRWVTATHTLRYRGHYHSRGGGHLYQGRFKSFPLADDEHFYVVCRYVERNPLRAGLVKTARDWPYGSLYRWNQPAELEPVLMTPWPIRRLPRWNERVDAALSVTELKAVRTSVDRSRPFGSQEWTEKIAERFGMWHTIRPAGRPRRRRKPAEGKQ